MASASFLLGERRSEAKGPLGSQLTGGRVGSRTLASWTLASWRLATEAVSLGPTASQLSPALVGRTALGTRIGGEGQIKMEVFLSSSPCEPSSVESVFSEEGMARPARWTVSTASKDVELLWGLGLAETCGPDAGCGTALVPL